jgi:hypothetical protein
LVICAIMVLRAFHCLEINSTSVEGCLKLESQTSVNKERYANIDNGAEPYFSMSDRILHHLPRPFPEDRKFIQSAVAVQSCVHDLMIYYRALLTALADQSEHNTTNTRGS